MTIIISVNGNKSGESFLIAPLGTKKFQVPLGLRTDDGTSVNATLQVASGGAGIAFEQTNITITGIEKFMNIYATSASGFINDTVLEVLVEGEIQATFNLTAIASPQIWFKGRFQTGFATDSDFYNEKRGTEKGWNFALEGEPDFVPDDSVPTDIDKPVGRVVRFNDPVALRTHVLPIGVRVSSIKGKVGTNMEEFFLGDPIIGRQVDLGPHTYLASNDPRSPTDPPPAETYRAGSERLALFEFHIANSMSGKSRNAEDRPKAEGLWPLTEEEQTQYDLIFDPLPRPSATFDNVRKDILLADYSALSKADRTQTMEGRNLATRIAHLGGEISEGIAPLKPTLISGWIGKEEFIGRINDSLTFQSFESSILSYLAGFDSLYFFARMFNYHSDEQCGQVHGYISVDPIVRDPRFRLQTDDDSSDLDLNLDLDEIISRRLPLPR
jgi:hypothetical protein